MSEMIFIDNELSDSPSNEMFKKIENLHKKSIAFQKRFEKISKLSKEYKDNLNKDVKNYIKDKKKDALAWEHKANVDKLAYGIAYNK